MNKYGASTESYWLQRKPKYSYTQACFLATYPPQTPRGLALDWTRASALRDWRLPSTAMERLATFESGHFSNKKVGIANGWMVRDSNLRVFERDFLFSRAIRSVPGPAQSPVLPLPWVKRSGNDFYYSLHLALRVSASRAITLLLLCVSNGMLQSYLYSLTPEDMFNP